MQMNNDLKEKIKDKIVLALDVEELDEAKALVDELFPYVGTFKVGLQLYTKYGNEVVDYISSKNSNFFLDVKLHDIPNTVEKASENVVLRGANFFNVHATGGLKMMKAAARGAKKAAEKLNKKPPIILAVTMLTSISQEVLKDEFEIEADVSNFAIRLAKLAKKAGLTGVVASSLEARKIKEACGADFKVLCPGIRPEWSSKDDQKRIATPKFAINEGADYLVIGRAVTQAENRVEAMEKIYEEIGELECLQR
ncbi:MAG: orotidine-5'-phosphate decarboxylase [Candidatus Gastranaerophilales bacterium]|nr:orotidine-5'-phosphate decarboxylase [Candidatus Gastranaerophilales bacterium]